MYIYNTGSSGTTLSLAEGYRDDAHSDVILISGEPGGSPGEWANRRQSGEPESPEWSVCQTSSSRRGS